LSLNRLQAPTLSELMFAVIVSCLCIPTAFWVASSSSSSPS